MKKMDLSELDKLSLGKKLFWVVQLAQGMMFVAMGLKGIFESNGGLAFLTQTAYPLFLGALGVLGSYFFLKGQRKGYGLLAAFELLILPTFSYGDYQYEMNLILHFKVWHTLNQTKVGIDVFPLFFLLLIILWFPRQRKSLS